MAVRSPAIRMEKEECEVDTPAGQVMWEAFEEYQRLRDAYYNGVQVEPYVADREVEEELDSDIGKFDEKVEGVFTDLTEVDSSGSMFDAIGVRNTTGEGTATAPELALPPDQFAQRINAVNTLPLDEPVKQLLVDSKVAITENTRTGISEEVVSANVRSAASAIRAGGSHSASMKAILQPMLYERSEASVLGLMTAVAHARVMAASGAHAEAAPRQNVVVKEAVFSDYYDNFTEGDTVLPIPTTFTREVAQTFVSAVIGDGPMSYVWFRVTNDGHYVMPAAAAKVGSGFGYSVTVLIPENNHGTTRWFPPGSVGGHTLTVPRLDRLWSTLLQMPWASPSAEPATRIAAALNTVYLEPEYGPDNGLGTNVRIVRTRQNFTMQDDDDDPASTSAYDMQQPGINWRPGDTTARDDRLRTIDRGGSIDEGVVRARHANVMGITVRIRRGSHNPDALTNQIRGWMGTLYETLRLVGMVNLGPAQGMGRQHGETDAEWQIRLDDALQNSFVEPSLHEAVRHGDPADPEGSVMIRVRYRPDGEVPHNPAGSPYIDGEEMGHTFNLRWYHLLFAAGSLTTMVGRLEEPRVNILRDLYAWGGEQARTDGDWLEHVLADKRPGNAGSLASARSVYGTTMEHTFLFPAIRTDGLLLLLGGVYELSTPVRGKIPQLPGRNYTSVEIIRRSLVIGARIHFHWHRTLYESGVPLAAFDERAREGAAVGYGMVRQFRANILPGMLLASSFASLTLECLESGFVCGPRQPFDCEYISLTYHGDDYKWQSSPNRKYVLASKKYKRKSRVALDAAFRYLLYNHRGTGTVAIRSVDLVRDQHGVVVGRDGAVHPFFLPWAAMSVDNRVVPVSVCQETMRGAYTATGHTRPFPLLNVTV